MEGERLAIEVVLVLVVAGLISAIIPVIRRRLTIALRSDVDYQDSIKRIEREWDEERKRYESRIQELERQVAFLLKELTKATSEIDTLKKNTQALRQNTPPARVLLICGNDDRFCASDRQALRRANVPFERLTGATKERIKAEFRRKREDGRPWRWVQISAHAGDTGVQLADGELAAPSWWNETLDGVTCILLAACQTMMVADQVAGLVRYVIAIREDIDNVDASEFVFSFWRGIVDGLLVPEAFEQACQETPQVAEYVVLRTA